MLTSSEATSAIQLGGEVRSTVDSAIYLGISATGVMGKGAVIIALSPDTYELFLRPHACTRNTIRSNHMC